MLKVEHLQKHYRNFSLDASLEVHPGMITGLIGRNGAGKTTLFKAVLGLISADGGKVYVFGKEGGKKMGIEEKQRIRVAFADSGFNDYLRLKDCADIMAAMYLSFDRELFFEKCRELSIPEDKEIKDFSTGMKAKLKVAAALSSHAALLILDEPTVGMDVIAREMILNLIRDYMAENEDCAVLISSHIASDIETLCDDIYLIDDGKICLHEDTDRLLSDYGLLKLTEKQYQEIDHQYLKKVIKESFGYLCLTDQKQFYLENYRDIVVEKGGIDDLLIMMNGGK